MQQQQQLQLLAARQMQLANLNKVQHQRASMVLQHQQQQQLQAALQAAVGGGSTASSSGGNGLQVKQ